MAAWVHRSAAKGRRRPLAAGPRFPGLQGKTAQGLGPHGLAAPAPKPRPSPSPFIRTRKNKQEIDSSARVAPSAQPQRGVPRHTASVPTPRGRRGKWHKERKEGLVAACDQGRETKSDFCSIMSWNRSQASGRGPAFLHSIFPPTWSPQTEGRPQGGQREPVCVSCTGGGGWEERKETKQPKQVKALGGRTQGHAHARVRTHTQQVLPKEGREQAHTLQGAHGELPWLCGTWSCHKQKCPPSLSLPQFGPLEPLCCSLRKTRF